MPWFPESLVKRDPRPTDTGLIVRPLFSGSGVVPVSIVGEVSMSFSGEVRPSSSSMSTISASTSSILLISGNENRSTAMFYNDSNKNLYLSLGSTSSTSSFTLVVPSSAYFEIAYPSYTGDISGVWAGGVTGSVKITELIR
jgi:hypothetical protein